MAGRFKTSLARIIAPSRFASLPAETRVYATRLNRLVLIIVTGWVVFAVQYLVQARYVTVGIDVAVICSTLAVHAWFLRQRTLHRMKLASNLVAGLSSLGLALAAMISGQSAAMATWFLVFVPIFMAHQEGVRVAVAWSLVAAALMAAVHGSEAWLPIAPEFVPSRFEVFAGQVVFLFAVLGIGVTTRRASDEQLRMAQDRQAELQKSRDASEKLRKRLATLVENVNVGVVLTDSKDCVLRINERFREQFGVVQPAGTLLGMSFEELCRRHITPIAAHGTQCALPETLTKMQEPKEFDLHDGRVIEFERIRIGDTSDEAGFVACYRDVTQQKEIERMKDEFVSTVSHELRTPLTAIRGSLALMAGGAAGELPEKSDELVRIADSNAERLVRLISDVLDLQRLKEGGMKLRFQRVAGDRLIRQVADALRPDATKQGVELVVRTNGGHLDFEGDPDRLTQVLTNLVGNAVAFSEAGEAVELTARSNNGRVRFEVRDQGPGIAVEDQHRLFRRFHQLDGSDRRPKGGTGLGLAISKALVEKHGGTIGVESDLGAGAMFWFEV